MNVRELLSPMPLLEKAEPEFMVIVPADSKSLFVIDTRPGLHQPMDKLTDLTRTQKDEEFLHRLQILP
jgi:hypothetical protein